MRRSYVLLSTFTLLLSSCASHHFQIATDAPPSSAPRVVELLADKQVANLHFPAGVYLFYAVDDNGWYYRAGRAIVQHTGRGPVVRSGGIYVNKSDPSRLRGYIFYAGAVTHVGDLSRTPHAFR